MLGASIMWALEPIFAKLSFQTIDFFNTFATRILFSFFVITIYILFTNPRQLIVNRKQLGWLLYLPFAATLFADFIYT